MYIHVQLLVPTNNRVSTNPFFVHMYRYLFSEEVKMAWCMRYKVYVDVHAAVPSKHAFKVGKMKDFG